MLCVQLKRDLCRSTFAPIGRILCGIKGAPIEVLFNVASDESGKMCCKFSTLPTMSTTGPTGNFASTASAASEVQTYFLSRLKFSLGWSGDRATASSRPLHGKAPHPAHSGPTRHRCAAPLSRPLRRSRDSPSPQSFAPPQTPMTKSVNGAQARLYLRMLGHVRTLGAKQCGVNWWFDWPAYETAHPVRMRLSSDGGLCTPIFLRGNSAHCVRKPCLVLLTYM